MAINFHYTFGLIPTELNVRRQSILSSRFICNTNTNTTSITAVETLKTSSSSSETASKPFPPAQPPPSPSPPSPVSSPATPNRNLNDEKGISQIQVPREKYIHVSKSRLFDSLLLSLRDINGGGDGDEDENDLVSQFARITSCLDSIIHAEHKRILEEMRADYFACQSIGTEGEGGVDEGEGEVNSGESVVGAIEKGINGDENGNETMDLELEVENQVPFLNGLDFFQLFNTSSGNSNVDDDARACGIATATRFQRSFMKLLQDAQFEELSVRDLILTSALNSDYLLTLPINVDWKRAYESNAIIFRRGYGTEKQKGLLIVEKLDYLQSKILQEVFGLIAKPLLQIGIWTKKVIQYAVESEGRPVWVKRFQHLLQESLLFQDPHNSMEQNTDASSRYDHHSNSDLPIWLAAQKAVSRYEGFLSSIGPRGRLLRKFLGWSGLLPSTPEVPFEFESDKDVNSEPHKRPVFLSRISLGDIWRPATRQYCGNNVWRILKVGFSIIFSRSVLQEPAFQELILLYTKETTANEIPSLQLKIYEKIPMPDLAVIFPHKKLSFRILDTVRLDIATIIGLLAYVINYKFEDVLSSPSAIMLDVIAVGALAIFLFRVALGYKQTWDRYQLLVNRTLYEKTLASGFGSIHFLLDASEQQQYKECILAYAILLKAENNQFTCRKSLGEECERFLYSMFKEKVQMPVDKAVDRLIRLGLVLEKQINGHTVLRVVPCSSAYDELKKLWDSLLS